MQRFVWVDNAKAILIFLVVLGHFQYSGAPVAGKDLIYAFHVPAFLCITGFLLPAEFGQIGLRRVLVHWAGVYLRAYGLFSLIAIMLWWLDGAVLHHQLASPLPPLLGALYGVEGQMGGFVHHDAPLWYFPFLVSALIGAWIVAAIAHRRGEIAGWLAAAGYASVALVYHGPRLPWDIDIAGMGTVMVFAGHRLRRHYPQLAPWIHARRTGTAIALALLALLGVASAWNGPVNINGAQFGASGVLFVIAALVGSGAVMLVAAQLPPSRLARAISANTLTIFALHIYLVQGAARLPLPAGGPGAQPAMWGLAAGIVLLCLPLARLLQPALRRWVNAPDPAASPAASIAET